MLRQGYGLLAQGPRRVTDEFVLVVGNRLRYSILPGHTTEGGYRAALFDGCYVVCRGVEVIELSPEATQKVLEGLERGPT